MVKVAFIVEGDVEKIVVEKCFIEKNWLEKYNITPIKPVINAGGGGNLCPKNIGQYIEQVETLNPDIIIILTDLECDPCIEKTKERLGSCDKCHFIIARKSFEAWFLADDDLLSILTKNATLHYNHPENTPSMPFDTLKDLMISGSGRGPGDKVQLAKKVSKLGFDIEKASTHANCQSAKYFVDKIKSIGQNS